MSAINFPNTPTAGDVHTEGDKSWTFTAGGVWLGKTDVVTSGSGAVPVRPPDTALFALSDLAAGTSASVDTSDSFWAMTRGDTGVAAAERLAFSGKAVPAGTWTASAVIQPDPLGRTSFFRSGLGVLEHSTGKCLFVGVNSGNGAYEIGVYSMASLTGPLTTVATHASNFPAMPVQFTIHDDGTHYVLAWSLDYGPSTETLATLAKSSYFTADRVGLVVETTGTWVVATQGSPSVRALFYSDPDFTYP